MIDSKVEKSNEPATEIMKADDLRPEAPRWTGNEPPAWMLKLPRWSRSFALGQLPSNGAEKFVGRLFQRDLSQNCDVPFPGFSQTHRWSDESLQPYISL